MGNDSAPAERTALDEIAIDLQALRSAAGHPSYAEIVRRIAAERQRRGEESQFALPGRTTVYDVFRHGRRRVDAALVGEIVRALGADENAVARWEQRCAQARGEVETTVESTVESIPAAPQHVDPASRPAPLRQRMALPITLRTVLLVMIGSVAMNLLGRVVVNVLHLPIYLDMLGTAFAAIALGPWWGAGVGLATNAVGISASGWASLAFAPVNVLGALIWGYGIRRLREERPLVPQFLMLCLVAATACSVVATPILVFVFDGSVDHGTDDITVRLLEHHLALLASVFAANLLSSAADKIISGFVALAAVEPLAARHGRSGGSGG